MTPNAPIYSISLGESRIFRIRNIIKKTRRDFVVDDGTLFVMGGNFQKEFKHEVPKSKKYKDRRINLTIRSFI